MVIRTKLFQAKIKWGKKYIDPDPRFYGSNMYKRNQLKQIREEIETEFPRYKNKIVFFEYVLDKTNL